MASESPNRAVAQYQRYLAELSGDKLHVFEVLTDTGTSPHVARACAEHLNSERFLYEIAAEYGASEVGIRNAAKRFEGYTDE